MGDNVGKLVLLPLADLEVGRDERVSRGVVDAPPMDMVVVGDIAADPLFQELATRMKW